MTSALDSLPLRAADDASPAAPSEADLVRGARSDADAFAALYRRHAPAIARYLRRRVADPEVARDLVAETFLAALERIGRYRPTRAPFRAWLYRLASTRVSRWARRERGRPRREPLTDGTASRPADAGGELVDRVRRGLLELPARQQVALALHYLEGLSIAEIAVALGCRPGTVKARLARGRERLRRRLEPYREEL